MLRVSASRAAANSPFEEGGATEELSCERAAPPMEQNATEELPTRFSNVTPRRRGRKSSGPLYSAGGTATQSYVPFDPFVYAPPPSRGSPARRFSLEADDFHYFDSLVQERVRPAERDPGYGVTHKFAREHEVFRRWAEEMPERVEIFS